MIANKKIIILFTSLITGLSNMEAQNQKVVQSSLKEATVFFTGAELTHVAKVNLSQGENEVLIEGLSTNIDLNSIKVKTANNVVVSSFEFSLDYLSSTKVKQPHVKKLTETIESYRKENEQLDIEIRINKTLIEQLQHGINKNLYGSESGLGIDDLIKTMDYMKSKSLELEKEGIVLETKKKDIQEKMRQVEMQLRQESSQNNKTSGVLRLNLLAPREGMNELAVIYFTNNASWSPSYDIHAADTDAPVQIRLRANVTQTTGFDWEKIKPVLSSGRPGNGKVAPLFTAWFLEQDIPKMRIQGINTLKNVAQNTFSYQKVRAEESAEMMDEEYDDVELSTVENYVVTSDNALDVHYEINLPYTIPGNGKVQYIDLQTYDVKAEYKYYATPKLDKQTYVLAELHDWEKLGLLSGKANINFNGTYLGETYLDANSSQVNQTLTLGTDPRIVVKREKVQDFSSNKMIGGDVVRQFTYKITVKNNRNHTVKLVVKDQYPLSTQKSIEVTLNKKETTSWTAINEEVGVVSWEEEFKAGETKVYQMSYTVKYPKDMKLNL